MRAVIGLYREAFSGLPRDVWLISAVGFVNRAGTMVMGLVALWLIEVHGLADGDAAQFMTFWGIGACIGVPLGGRLSDRIGPVPVQVLSFVGVSCAFMALPGLGNVWLVGGTIVLVGVLGEAFRPANAALLASTCPPELRTQAFALHRLAINAGWTIGPIAGGFIAEYGGWAPVFQIDAATCTVSALLLWYWFGRRPVDVSADDEQSASEAAGVSPWKDGAFLAFVGCVVLVAFVFMQFLSTFPVYLSRGLGWRKDEIGLIIAINPVMITLFEMVLVRRLQRPNPTRIIALGAACLAVGFGLLWVSDGFGWIAFCMVLVTIGEMLESPFTSSFVANRAPKRAVGRYMGVYALAFSVAFILAPLIGGAVRDAAGWTPLWLGCCATGLLASVGFLTLGRRMYGDA